MGHIDVKKNTVVKNTPETFELIKALFKANGVNTDYRGFIHAKQDSKYVGPCIDSDFCCYKTDDDKEITLQQLAFESLAAPEWATMIAAGFEGYVWLEHNTKGRSGRGRWLSGREFETSYKHGWRESDVVLQKQSTSDDKPKPANYRKVSGLEPWEIVKRWQESDDLYFHHADIGFSKVMHLQQLANLIHQDMVYKQCSEREIYAEKVRSFPVLCHLSDCEIKTMWSAGLRFVEDITNE